ncbi:MAG: hypothetical protein LBJ67_01210 [Planctomycetaceae bacterium]|nr:hypothetical protein [Planctomycetaceae bacterium]
MRFVKKIVETTIEHVGLTGLLRDKVERISSPQQSGQSRGHSNSAAASIASYFL